MATDLNPVIFLSYSWANTATADEIDNDFKSIGIQFRRDVRDAPYRSSIKEFMQQIGKSDFVLMLISDEYLKSENCLYEVTELLNTHEFEKKILPIVLDNARHIFKSSARVVYYKYWNEKLDEARQLKIKHPNKDYLDLVKKITNINDSLDVFFEKVTDLNVSAFEKLKHKNYRDLLNIIGFSNERLLEEVIRISQIEEREIQELELEKFLETHYNNKYGIFLKAHLADDAKQYIKAKNYYESVISIDPRHAGAYNNLAIIMTKHFLDYESAKQYYEEAIRIDPQNPFIHNNLALLLKNHFINFEDAKFHYEQAILIDPHGMEAHYNLANLLRNDFSDFYAARFHYEEAMRINPQHAGIHNNLATLLEQFFYEFGEARSHYEEAIRIDPQNPIPYVNLAMLLEYSFSDIEGATYYHKAATNLNPQYDFMPQTPHVTEPEMPEMIFGLGIYNTIKGKSTIHIPAIESIVNYHDDKTAEKLARLIEESYEDIMRLQRMSATLKIGYVKRMESVPAYKRRKIALKKTVALDGSQIYKYALWFNTL